MEKKLLQKPDVTPEELIDEAKIVLSQALASARTEVTTPDYKEGMSDDILIKAREAAKPMVARIEQLDPGGRFGKNKVTEMDELATESDEIGSELGFTKNARSVLKVTLGTHDIGRHVEKILNLETTRAGIRHGAFSLLFLAENELLEGLSEKDKYIVLFSVYYHAEMNVPKPEQDAGEFEKTAYEICYVLRDMDKAHSLEESKYFEPKGILAQLKAHYLTEKEREIIKSFGLDPQIENLLDGKLRGDKQSIEGLEIFDTINKIMDGKVNEEILEYFDRQELVPVQLLKSSWSSYLALRLAMLFDIKNKSILRRVIKEDKKYIDASLDYIKLRDPLAAEKINKKISSL